MYSRSDVAVDKGLGFDFSEITNLVKSALPVGLNIFQQQQQLKQVKAMGQFNLQNGVYVPSVQLPASQMYGMAPQTNIPQPYYSQSSGMSTTTMLAIGAAVVAGVVAFKLLR